MSKEVIGSRKRIEVEEVAEAKSAVEAESAAEAEPDSTHQRKVSNETPYSKSAATASSEELIDFGERYSLLSEIGSGGMSLVYKILDRQLNQVFAAKVVHPDKCNDYKAQDRLRREAHAATQMTHGNIATVYGEKEAKDGSKFLLMEYLDGESLDQILEREGVIDPERALLLIRQICDALNHVHMKGVVHRDLKPSNIFISKTNEGIGVVKLLDFGISLSTNESDSRITKAGAILGSPFYMSPEQILGDELTPQSDVYSLGCVMYRMLTGRLPFAASSDNFVKVGLSHVRMTPEPFGEESLVPQSLQSCVMRCLEKDLSKRYSNVDEVVFGLSEDLEAPNIVLRPSPLRRLTAMIFDGAILGILSVFVLIAIAFSLEQLFPHGAWVRSLITLGRLQISGLDFVMWEAFGFFFIALFCPVFLVQGIILYLLYDIDFILLPTSIPVLLLVALVYYTFFEISPLKATPGKLMCRLAVIAREGRRLTLGTSLRRHFYKFFALSSVFAAARILLVDSKISIRSRWNCIVDVLSRPPWDEWSKTLVVDKKQQTHAFGIDTYSTRINNLTIAQLHSIHTGFFRSIIWILVADLVIVYLATPSMMFVFCPLVAFLAIAPVAVYWRQVNVRKKQLLARRRRMAALETSLPASAKSQFD